MKVRLKRHLLLYIILFLAAMVAFHNQVLLLGYILLAGNIYIALKYMKRRMYFNINELPEFNRPKPDEPICCKCGYDLRGTFAASIYDCPECNQPADDETIANWKNATREDN